jgi:hypothetical protein
MAEEDSWKRLLRDSLAVLAMPPEVQIRINGPGCLACDLLNDFDDARSVTMANATLISEPQRHLLNAIDAALNRMEPPDFECFNNSVVYRPSWGALRQLAAAGLRAFGWEAVVVRSFVETRPGIWQRPLADSAPDSSA